MGLVIDITERQIELLQISIVEMSAQGDKVTAEFYARLFQVDPGLRYLFPDDLTDQRHSLTFMMDFIVRRLHRWDEIRPRLRNLAIRHVSYGVRPADYGTFGKAMIETLADYEEDAETVAAWKALFESMSATMIEASE
jgi:methyl-accepting chemotaxis protein